MSIEDAEELAIRIGKGTGWLLFGTLTAEIIAFFYRIMLARWLGPYEYGIFALLLMLIGFGTTFFTLGLPQALTKYISEYRAKGKATDRIFSTGLALTIFLGIMSVLSVFLLAEPLTLFVFKNPDAISSLQIGSFALFFVLLGNLFNGAIQGWQKMKYSAIGIITDKLTKFVATAILFWLGFGLLGASVALIFSFCAVALVLALLYRRLTPISISYIDYKTTKILIIFGMPVFFTSIAGYFLGWTDTLIISHFMTEEWVGYYNAALPILWILSLAIGSLATVLFSTFSELKAKKSVYIEKTINRSLKYAFYMLIPGAVGGWLLAEPIIRILFGPAYLPAASAFQILIFCAL
ncbi:MAG: flippase, partial [Candidatus Aenigmatarchaeota archaeon]